ncbi:MaoC/PaaZ C-terminal domain-containing protein [Actinomycetospora sp.]|uniref:MaoC/PaaZ C-terminal domain-containing protein n=1 Tax=Actinomycetospora sp. TaxID=1872135 RepID=UPI002F40A8F7
MSTEARSESTGTGIDPGAVGSRSTPREVSWTDRDTMFYALAVGAGTDDLALTTENSRGVAQQVLPSFAVIPATRVSLLRKLGDVDMGKVLHASEAVRLFRPLPPAGSLSVEFEITGLSDKGPGKNAFVTITGRGTDPESGEPVVETEMGLALRGAGGFGGTNSPTGTRVEIPDRDADLRREDRTRADQALLYRLTGDRNPLHSDPTFAAKVGFERPILHGLATYGFATRALVRELADGDPDRLRTISCRFAAPVLPGDLLATRVWRTGTGSALFRTEAVTDGAEPRTVLDDGVAEYL